MKKVFLFTAWLLVVVLYYGVTMKQQQIVKGSIVKYNGNWYRVTAIFSNSVNLGGVFGGKVYHKRVPLNEVVEDEAAWYKVWQQSETYQCM